MEKLTELQNQARALTQQSRQDLLTSMPEVEMHHALKDLFEAMMPDSVIEVTHGVNELGKDLVIFSQTPLTTDVIGVVVKRGDISGKTVGDVDEIKDRVAELTAASQKVAREISSQIEQARTHPAQLKTMMAALPITKVIVVLAGKLSENGRKRLDAELKNDEMIYDVIWLTEKFTHYYPQVFFEGRCIDFLQEKIQQLETGNWILESSKNLSDYWVDPLVSTTEVPTSFDAESLMAFWDSKQMPFSRLNEAIKEGRHLILVGDAGTGKSAALARIAISMLRSAYAQATKEASRRPRLAVPILVTSKELWEAETTEDLISSYFGSVEVTERFQVAALLVDGLDAMPHTRRLEMIDKARDFARQMSCSLVITSRKIEIVREAPSGFRKYELMPFEFGQALKLYEKLMGKTALLDTLREGLSKIEHQVPMIPLSLVLLMDLVEKYQEVPSSISELYERYVDMALGRHEDKKGIEVLFEYVIKKRFLASLAYHEFYLKERFEIGRDEFEAFSQAYGEEFGYQAEQMEDFIHEIDRAGLLLMGEPIEFRHRNFLDYFVGFYLFDSSDEIENMSSRVVETYFDDFWTESVFFYVGLKRKLAQPLLEKLLDFTQDDPKRSLSLHLSKMMVGRLLQAGWNSPDRIKSYGIERALSHASLVRNEFLDAAQNSQADVPRIFAEFMIMVFAEVSFRSGHLAKQLKSLLQQSTQLDSEETAPLHPRDLPFLIYALKPFLSTAELQDATELATLMLGNRQRVTMEEEATALVLLNHLPGEDKIVLKSVEKRLNKLKQKHPEVFKAVLPTPRPGFRPKKHKPKPAAQLTKPKAEDNSTEASKKN